MIPSSEVRKLLERHGKRQPQDASQWQGAIPLLDAIADFYREVGPVD